MSHTFAELNANIPRDYIISDNHVPIFWHQHSSKGMWQCGNATILTLCIWPLKGNLHSVLTTNYPLQEWHASVTLKLHHTFHCLLYQVLYWYHQPTVTSKNNIIQCIQMYSVWVILAPIWYHDSRLRVVQLCNCVILHAGTKTWYLKWARTRKSPNTQTHYT